MLQSLMHDARDMAALPAPALPLEPSDAELVARTCAGEAAAFETLVRRHYRAAFSVALAATGNRTDAEDICQDAFVRAAQRLEDCRDPARFIAWLCVIVRNHAKNVMTRGGIRGRTPLTDTIAGPADSGRRAELAELRTRLESALATLSPVQRDVVLLHDLDGWTHEAIAASIGTSAGMSRQYLFNARRRLREILGGDILRDFLHD